MTPKAQRCRGCGAALFPARCRCFRCASTEFDLEPMDRGVVLEFTQVHRVPPSCDRAWLLEVQASNGARVIAVCEHEPQARQGVLLRQEHDGAIVADLTWTEKEESHG